MFEVTCSYCLQVVLGPWLPIALRSDADRPSPALISRVSVQLSVAISAIGRNRYIPHIECISRPVSPVKIQKVTDAPLAHLRFG